MRISQAHLREYETIFVLKPDIDDAVAINFIEKMKGLIEREGGKHLKVTNWGRKKLAWERLKQQKGMYVHHHYLGKPGLVAEYERTLAIEEAVILRQTTVVSKGVDPAARHAEEDVLQPPVTKERRDDRKDRDQFRDDEYGVDGDDEYGDM